MSLKLAQMNDFILACNKEYLDYDFEIKDMLFYNWQTRQAYAVYQLGIEKGVKRGTKK